MVVIAVIQREEREEIHWLREDHSYTLGGHRNSPLLQEDLLTLWVAALMKSLADSKKRNDALLPPGQRKVVITRANEYWL